MNTTPVVTITFFRFSGFRNKFWAFSMMQLGHKFMKNMDGLRFYKLMGTGRGMGFNWKGDFSVYALLTVWDNEAQAEAFQKTSRFHEAYRSHCKEEFITYMKPLRSHGQWDAQNPFIPETKEEGHTLAVITRGEIKNRYLYRFWKHVPASSHSLSKSKGLLFAKGIGEWPFKFMATFSIWESEAFMQEFAYKSDAHRQAIKKTRELNWFKEDLFARFRPYKVEGTWEGELMNMNNLKSDFSHKKD